MPQPPPRTMSRLYHVLREPMARALDLYFVDIQSRGQEHVPAEGPLIFAANHPNSIMDTVLLGTQTSRQVHYLARSGLYDNPLVARLFDAVGVIPVYRSQDNTDTNKNQSTFERAFELLEQGRCLGIFPEGRNSEERRVLEIKTGTARIALGAEARHDFSLGVRIVPVGLNFLDRDQFLTAVLLRFGEPIRVEQWAEQWVEDDREAVRDLTRVIQKGIEQQTVHVADDLVAELTEALLQISGAELLTTLAPPADEGTWEEATEDQDGRGWRRRLFDVLRSVEAPEADELEESFELHQQLADALTARQRTHPEEMARLRAAIRSYRDHLSQVRLRDDFGERDPGGLSSRKDAVRLTAYALLYGPIAIWGLIHNVLPYQLARLAALRAPDEAIRAMTAFLAGAVFFIAWYGLIGWGLWAWNKESAWVALLYVATLGPAGFFFLNYRRRVAGWRDRILTRTLFRTRRNLAHALMRERERLLDQARALLSAEPPTSSRV